MSRCIARIALTVVGALALTAAAKDSVRAQALGPQRQFLAVEPYYERTQLDVGSSASKEGMNGFGARLWINLDPFHFIQNSSIAIYGSRAPSQSGKANSLSTFGAEYDQYFMRRPLGGIIDPFIALGGGATWIRPERNTTFGRLGSQHAFGTAVIGGGFRIPAPNRFELRLDAKDAIIFNTPTGTSGTKRTSNNLLLQAGLGVTF